MNPQVTAGWYADPWKMAPLRWWDGVRWSGHTHDGAQPAAVTERPPRQVETNGKASGYVVVDVETTGFSAMDRVVEVACVTLDERLRIVDEWDTLLNPQRDIGATHIHGITASMLVKAPVFGDVAGGLAQRLHGRVVVAHNFPFDKRMICGEYQRLDIDADLGDGLDTQRLAGGSLDDACRRHGIEFAAHRALDDARAAAQLLSRVGSDHHRSRPAILQCSLPTTCTIVTRDMVTTALPDHSDEVLLEGGEQICFTGSAFDNAGSKIERSTLAEVAKRYGFEVTKRVTKAVALVAVADPQSESRKARKAREYGIPMVRAIDFLGARPGDYLKVWR